MLRFLLMAILLMLVARAFWRVVDGIVESTGHAPPRAPGSRPIKLVRDPVCGTHVALANARSLTVGGETHYFCSERCRNEFQRISSPGSQA